jgi:hypothetical protein
MMAKKKATPRRDDPDYMACSEKSQGTHIVEKQLAASDPRARCPCVFNTLLVGK